MMAAAESHAAGDSGLPRDRHPLVDRRTELPRFIARSVSSIAGPSRSANRC